MNTYFKMFWIFLIIAIFTTQLHAFKWCNLYQYNKNHPMVAELEFDKKVLLNTLANQQVPQRKKFYQKQYDKFILLYTDSDDFNDDRVQKTISALQSYIKDLHIKGERPTVWNASDFYDYSKQMNEIRLQGIGNTPVKISCNEFEKQNIESAVLAIAYLSRYMESLSSHRKKDYQIFALAEAQLTSEGYQSWIFNGLSQWPWEMKVNELLIPDEFNGNAPDFQLTFLRPNLGFAINPNDYNNADLDYALMFEPIGFVKYFSDDGKTDYDNWWGVSALMTITDDNGAGYGLLGRYNNFIVGATIHDSQDQDWLIYFGVDLYKYLLGEDGKVKQYQELRDKYISSH